MTESSACGQLLNTAQTTRASLLFRSDLREEFVNINLTYLSELIISAYNMVSVLRLAFIAFIHREDLSGLNVE
jgi:hypothetical protein